MDYQEGVQQLNVGKFAFWNCIYMSDSTAFLILQHIFNAKKCIQMLKGRRGNIGLWWKHELNYISFKKRWKWRIECWEDKHLVTDKMYIKKNVKRN